MSEKKYTETYVRKVEGGLMKSTLLVEAYQVFVSFMVTAVGVLFNQGAFLVLGLLMTGMAISSTLYKLDKFYKWKKLQK